MSADHRAESDDPRTWAPEAIPGVRLLPVLHERVDLAAVVRAALEALQPAVVAVELPSTLETAALAAVRRLPRITVVLSEEPGSDPLLWVVAPGDPLVEALRWALENGRRTLLIDPDVRYRDRHRDPVPDPHALWSLGPGSYLKALRRICGERRSPSDEVREAGMAYHLQRARRSGEEILAVVGAAHADALAERLRHPTARPLARTRRTAVELRHLDPDSLTAVLVDAPLAHAVYELLRAGELEPAPARAATLSTKVSLVRHGLRVITGERDDDRLRRRRALPLYCAHAARRWLRPGIAAVDRLALGRALWEVAASSYAEQTEEVLAGWQRRVFLDFAGRYARVQGLLVPGLYEWVVAARGVADDNLAWEVFDAARSFPWQQEANDLPSARIDGEELDLGSRRVRFRRRFFRVKRRPVRVPVRRRPEVEDPEAWLAAFDTEGICSYPKEDLVIEDYGRFLQRKAVSVLSAENRRTEPFSTSLMDGLDLRETLRHLHEGKIFVRVDGRVSGTAGSVVVIFDRDLEGDRFPYLMTWHGEHDQESDMIFYATDPAQQVVGPGILRATYGGFAMTYPPGRLSDPWLDPDYHFAAEKAEVLVMAAVDYSEEPLVVHVAPQPPSAQMKAYAAAQGKRLVHIPIATLSPVAVKRVRVMHLLAGRDTREIAGEYIW